MNDDSLEVRQVTVRFGGLTALDGVSLTAPPNQVTGIIGPNGAGKTTLLNVLCGLVRPESGSARFAGRELLRLRPHQLAGLGIARTLQGVGLFGGLSVAENVMVGATCHARAGTWPALLGLLRSDRDERMLRARAMAALELVGVAEHADRMPGTLPYGVRKRVALARALASGPRLLLLDEPASGLSEQELGELGTLISALARDLTLVIIEHRMDLMMSACDSITVLDFGKVIAAGTPGQVQADPAVTAAYLGIAADGGEAGAGAAGAGEGGGGEDGGRPAGARGERGHRPRGRGHRGRLRGRRRAARRHGRRAGRHDHGRARRQRGRQDDPAAHGQRDGPAAGRADRGRRGGCDRPPARADQPGRRGPCPRGPGGDRRADRRGEPAAGRAEPAARGAGGRAGRRLRALPRPGAAAGPAGGHAVRRRAAGPGDRQGAHVPPPGAAAGRAVPRPGPPGGRPGDGPGPVAARGERPERAARRAERPQRPVDRRHRDRAQPGPGGGRRPGGRPGRGCLAPPSLPGLLAEGWPMQEFVEFTLGGIASGMVYAAIALSLVLIWRGTRILNFAQGGLAMLTTYLASIVISRTGSYWEGFAAGLAAGLVLGAVAERTVIRPVESKGPMNAVIVTIGLLIFIEGLAGIIFGGQYRSFPPAFSIVGLRIGSFSLGISRNDVFTAGAVLAAAVILAVVFRYTPVGLRLRAAAFGPQVARLLGVRVGRVLTLGWALAGLFGALAGVLVTPSTFLYPNSMDAIFVLGFTAAVIGGLDSPVGAVVGGLILGVVLEYVGGYLGSDIVPLFGLAALVLVLMVRPSGLFSAATTRQV